MTRFKRTALLLCLLAGGVYCAGSALWNMGRTAMFVHEAVVVPATVVDMEKRPFSSQFEAMGYGNLPWDGETAYRPHIVFTIPCEPAPVHIQLPIPVNDWDNRDYTTGQEVEAILPPSLPEMVRLNRFKFLWGGDCLLLLLGLALSAAGYLPLRRRKSRAAKASRPAAAHKPAAPKPSAPAKPAPKEEEPFLLEPAPPPKKKRTRKPKDPSAPAKPRKPRKKKSPEA